MSFVLFLNWRAALFKYFSIFSDVHCKEALDWRDTQHLRHAVWNVLLLRDCPSWLRVFLSLCVVWLYINPSAKGCSRCSDSHWSVCSVSVICYRHTWEEPITSFNPFAPFAIYRCPMCVVAYVLKSCPLWCHRAAIPHYYLSQVAGGLFHHFNSALMLP